MKAWIGIGSNLGDRAGIMLRAAQRMRALSDSGSIRLSHLYETRPMGLAEQGDFLNAAASFDTEIAPEGLLSRLKEIESELGRVAGPRNGPRAIDLDILDLGGIVRASPDPILPHPRLAERAFVLVPLCEITPDWRDPRDGRTAAELLADLDPDPEDVRLFGRFEI